MKIEIDTQSGFCFGVITAIQKAEEELKKKGHLFCLGDIVHNGVEVNRLKQLGLETITHEMLRNLHDCTVLLRAHGEPPSTYELARKNNITLIDATCPVVLGLQKRIKKGFEEIAAQNGQIVIFGKQGHAEVNGLVGQTNEQAIVVTNVDEIEKIDFSRPVHLFSQTTQSQRLYNDLQEKIKQRMKNVEMLKTTDSICRQVSNREDELRLFAQNHDVIVFVSGRKSSNGKVLYNVCKDENQRTYFVSDIEDLQNLEINSTDTIGICGATSTPKWLMINVANEIEKRFNN